MTKLSQAVEAVAQQTGIKRNTIGIVARHLRESGLLPMAGRGNAAADLDLRDMATLIAGVCIYAGGVFAAELPDELRKDPSHVDRVLAAMDHGAPFVFARRLGAIRVLVEWDSESLRSLAA
jgi:hypothetical protein